MYHSPRALVNHPAAFLVNVPTPAGLCAPFPTLLPFIFRNTGGKTRQTARTASARLSRLSINKTIRRRIFLNIRYGIQSAGNDPRSAFLPSYSFHPPQILVRIPKSNGLDNFFLGGLDNGGGKAYDIGG